MLKLKQLIKKISVVVGFDTFITKRSKAGIILGFHNIDLQDHSMFSQRIALVDPDALEGLLRYLQSLGYSFTSLSEFVNGSDISKKAAITFDDGFKSVYLNAFPILSKFKAPFTVFLTTATLGASRLLWQHRIYAAVDRLAQKDIYAIIQRYTLKAQSGDSLRTLLGNLICQESPERLLVLADELSSEARLSELDESYIAERLYLQPGEIEEMMQDGMTVGAHGHNHWCLETLDHFSTETEISICKEKIQKNFGVQVKHYALPFGKPNPYIYTVLEHLGFQSLCTTEPGLVQANTDPYALPRLMDHDDVLGLAGQITQLHLQRIFSKIL